MKETIEEKYFDEIIDFLKSERFKGLTRTEQIVCIYFRALSCLIEKGEEADLSIDTIREDLGFEKPESLKICLRRIKDSKVAEISEPKNKNDLFSGFYFLP